MQEIQKPKFIQYYRLTQIDTYKHANDLFEIYKTCSDLMKSDSISKDLYIALNNLLDKIKDELRKMNYIIKEEFINYQEEIMYK